MDEYEERISKCDPEAVKQVMQKLKSKLEGKQLNNENLKQALYEMELELKVENKLDWEIIHKQIRNEKIQDTIFYSCVFIGLVIFAYLILRS